MNIVTLLPLLFTRNIVFFVTSLPEENASSPFTQARAHWIRAVTKVRLQLQEVGNFVLVMVGTVFSVEKFGRHMVLEKLSVISHLLTVCFWKCMAIKLEP